MGMVYDVASASVASLRGLKYVLFENKSKSDASVV